MKKYIPLFEEFENEFPDAGPTHKQSDPRIVKDKWWDINFQKLIDYASELEYEDWIAYLNDDEEAAEAAMDSTGKDKALTLLGMLPIDALDDLIKEE